MYFNICKNEAIDNEAKTICCNKNLSDTIYCVVSIEQTVICCIDTYVRLFWQQTIDTRKDRWEGFWKDGTPGLPHPQKHSPKTKRPSFKGVHQNDKSDPNNNPNLLDIGARI